MLNTFLFDLDGTLTDSQEGIANCLRYALQELQAPIIPSQQELASYIGITLRECFCTLLGTNDNDIATHAIALYRKRFAVEGKFENKVYDGIPEALEYLRSRGARLFVATSKHAGFSREILEHFGLAPYFNGIYGSQPDGTLENKTELIAHLVEREQLDPSTAIMIGDRKFDIIGGQNNCTSTAGVLWGYGTLAELQEAGAQRVLHTPADIRTLV